MTKEALTSEQILEKVKKALGITGDYQNDTLSIYINDVISFLEFAGISEEIIYSSVAVGVICRGVTDLWNYGAGGATFSEYFKQRVTQLALSEVTKNE